MGNSQTLTHSNQADSLARVKMFGFIFGLVVNSWVNGGVRPGATNPPGLLVHRGCRARH